MLYRSLLNRVTFNGDEEKSPDRIFFSHRRNDPSPHHRHRHRHWQRRGVLRALGGVQADDVEPRGQGLEVPFHREGRFPERIRGRTGAVGGGEE